MPADDDFYHHVSWHSVGFDVSLSASLPRELSPTETHLSFGRSSRSLGFSRSQERERTVFVFSQNEYRKCMESRRQTRLRETCQVPFPHVLPFRSNPFFFFFLALGVGCGGADDRGGDVVLFALSLGILMTVFERAPASITGGTVRKTMSWISGRGFVDPVPGADEMRNSAPGIMSTTTIATSPTVESSSESPESGSIVLESMGSSSLGSDVGEGVRVLDDELVKSPMGM
jgi:hypothetical protein